jgi:hypothetical protein
MTKDECLAEVREIGEQLKALRAKMSPDSPLAGVAFELAALAGTIESKLSAAPTGNDPE